MTCPTCQGRAYVADDACPRCYATGSEPDAAPPHLVAARLSLRATALLTFADDPRASYGGRQATTAEAARVLAASIRIATPSTLRDLAALSMTLRLIECGADHEPFVAAVRSHLTRYGLSELLAHAALALRVRDDQRAATARRIERRIDA